MNIFTYNNPYAFNFQKINKTNNSFQKNYLNYYNLSFRGKDLLELSKEDIFQKVKESIKPENFIGQGTEAKVYRLNDSDYCVRIPYEIDDLYTNSYSRDLTPVDRVNHTKIKLGFGATIMEFFDGIIPKNYMNNESERYKLQKIIARMPIKSYSDLLHQIANAIDNDMFFDYSGGNLIIDTKKQRFTAIDFCKMPCDFPRAIRPLTEMYNVLTCYGAELDTGKKIFDKIVSAGLEEFKPENIPCMDLALFDFEDLLLKRNRDNKLDKNNLSGQINEFLDLKCNILKKLKELKCIKKEEIRDKCFAKILENKIFEFRNIIKQAP